MQETLLAGDAMLSNAYSEIWTSLTKAGHLTKWLAFLSESMDMESETKQLTTSFNSLRDTRNSIAAALVGICTKLENKLNGEEGEEREREKGVSKTEV